jgi:hypothetical protein
MNQSDTEVLLQAIAYLLGPGAGVAVYLVVQWIIQQLTDAGKQPSPFASRWIGYGVAVALPTALYALFLWLAAEPFSVATYIIDVLTAFGMGTFIHGQRDLARVPVETVPLTKQEVAAKKVEEPTPDVSGKDHDTGLG